MKFKLLIFFIGFILMSNSLRAQQWIGTNPIYYSVGNVGIGTTTPQKKLDVNTGINNFISFGSTLTTVGQFSGIHFGYLEYNNAGYRKSGLVFELVDVNAAKGKIHLLNNSSSNSSSATLADAKMTIDHDGKVGIGTKSPISTLDVFSPSSTMPAFHVFKDGTNGQLVELQRFSAPGSTAAPIFNVAAIMAKTNGTNSSQSYLSLNPININGTGFVDGLSIYAGGNVGIGTTTPNNKLQVGPNPSGFSGNDLVVSNTTGSLAISNGVANSVNYTMLYGSADIAIKPGYGKMAIYANSAGNVGIGSNSITESRFYIYQSSNTEWAMSVFNDGGDGKGVKIKGGDGASLTPLLQIDDNLNATKFKVLTNGNVGIGTSNPDHKLDVNGVIHAKEIIVDLNVPGPDYVFEPDYDLPTLTEIETFIKENKHLPEVPSAKEMEANGIKLMEMNVLLLKKVEELTLHLIEQNKKLEKQQVQIDKLNKK